MGACKGTNIIVMIVLIVFILIIHNFCVLFQVRRYIIHTLVDGGGQHGDLMRLIIEKLSTKTQASGANMTSFQCYPTNLRCFYLSFTIACSLASICHTYQLIEATLMYRVQ